MTRQADALVIGAGLSGSIVAAYLAKGGLRTIVFESTGRIGGPKYGSYTMNGYRADLTHIPSWAMRWNGGNGWWVKAAEEVGASIQFQCLPPWVFHQGGRMIKVPYCTGPKAFARFLNSMVPMELPEATEHALEKVFSAATAMPQETLFSEQMDTTPAKEWLDEITDDELARFLLGNLGGMIMCLSPEVALTKLSVQAFVGSFLCGAFGGRVNNGYTVGGAVDEIPKAFCKVAMEHGAEIKLSHRVKRVLIENGKAKGVVVSTPDGREETYRAERVIISTEYGAYPALLGELLPAQIAQTIKDFDSFPITSLDVHYGIKRPILSPAWSFVWMLSDANEIIGLIASLPHFEQSLVPEGKQLVQFQTFKPTKIWEARSQEEWIQELLDAGEAIYPGLKDEIECRHVTVVKNPWLYQLLPVRKIPFNCPGIANLYFTGDSTGAPNFVTERAASSAMIVARQILQKESGELFRVKGNPETDRRIKDC
ncbi:MAG: FAD-dependent oxidoreductase [Dehalococcoidia bacterium]